MSNPAKSLAFLEFEQRHRGEADTFWRLAAAMDFSERWWNTVEPEKRPSTIANGTTDPLSAEARIHVSPDDFIANRLSLLLWGRAYALVGIVTSFESYLRRALERALIVRPELLTQFEMQLSVKDVWVPAQDGGFREWIAERVADHFIRQRTHPEAYRRLDVVFKCGIREKKNAELEEWQRLTLLRNAVVHESRSATPELVRAWPDRFPDARRALVLKDEDIDRAHDLGANLAASLDRRYATAVIKDADACELACQLYWKSNIKEPEQVMMWVKDRLNYDLDIERVREVHQLCAAGRRSFP